MSILCSVACSTETAPAGSPPEADNVVATPGQADAGPGQVDAGPPQADAGPAQTDAGTCDTLNARIRDFDGIRSCESADDCHLVGAYYIRPRGNSSAPEGVFVSDADKPLVDMLLAEAIARGCIGPDCAVDGETYRAACVAGTCVAAPRCCNCPPYPGSGCLVDGTEYAVGDVVPKNSSTSCVCLDDGGIGHCTGAL